MFALRTSTGRYIIYNGIMVTLVSIQYLQSRNNPTDTAPDSMGDMNQDATKIK